MIHTYPRRDFLRLLAGAGAAGLMSPFLSSCAHCPPGIPPPTTRRVLADLHVHSVMDEWLKKTPAAVESPELLSIAQGEFNPTRAHWKHVYQAGVDLMCVAHFNLFDEWLSMPTDPSADAPAHTLQMMEHLESLLRGEASRYARLVTTPADLEKSLRHRPGDDDYRVTVLHTLEGAHALAADPKHIAAFARRGVALITLTHFFNKGLASAPNSYPFFPDARAAWAPAGLSERGKEFIAEMEANGVILDVTHMTDHALDDTFKTATRPFVATHSSARALGDHPYSFPNEHLQEIAHRDGLVGVILYPHVLSNFNEQDATHEHGSIRDVVRTIRHVSKVCGGPRFVAVGSDYSGYIQGLKEFSCLGQIDLLRRALKDEFGDDDVVEGIMAGNAIAFIQKNWGTA